MNGSREILIPLVLAIGLVLSVLACQSASVGKVVSIKQVEAQDVEQVDDHPIPRPPVPFPPPGGPDPERCDGVHRLANITDTYTVAPSAAACGRRCAAKLVATSVTACAAHCPTHACAGAPTCEFAAFDVSATFAEVAHAGHFDCRCWSTDIQCECECV